MAATCSPVHLVPEVMDTFKGLGEAEADVLVVESEYRVFVHSVVLSTDGAPGNVSSDDKRLSSAYRPVDGFSSLWIRS